MKNILVSVFIIAILTSACNLGGGRPPIESTVTLPAIVSPTDTQIPPISTSSPTPTPPASLGTVAQDFVALLCDAQWMNGGQHLTPCPSVNADHSGGYAVAIDPTSEGLPEGTPVLLTIPAWNGYAALFLRYPSLTIHTGDRFRAMLGCQTGSACDVIYALEYFDAQGKYHPLFLSWKYNAGEPALSVDADISTLAGQTVDLVLAIQPQNDTPLQDKCLWIAPYIYRFTP